MAYKWVLHSGKLTQQWKIPLSNRKYIYKRPSFHFHVSLPEVTIIDIHNYLQVLGWSVTKHRPKQLKLPPKFATKSIPSRRKQSGTEFIWVFLVGDCPSKRLDLIKMPKMTSEFHIQIAVSCFSFKNLSSTRKGGCWSSSFEQFSSVRLSTWRRKSRIPSMGTFTT